MTAPLRRVAADWIYPAWPAPRQVLAVSTTRHGGVSEGPFARLNLSLRVGDAPEHVTDNRHALRQALDLPSEPAWLRQVHGNRVVEAAPDAGELEADASITRSPGPVCVVATADCVPVLLCAEDGKSVAAIHAGWRGFCEGVMEATVERFADDPRRTLAWIGPAISADAYEVGAEVRERLLESSPDGGFAFSRSANPGRWLADLPGLVEARLRALGIARVYRENACTFSEPERFFSYRRDGETGRMATLIWLGAP